MSTPLAVDIDGTLSRRDRSVDPRVFDALRHWSGPIVIATGKALPFPVGLCQCIGIPERVIAENGAIALTDDDLTYHGDREAADAVAREYRQAGHELGWDGPDLVNRWRETEIAVARESPLAPLREIAAAYGLEVVDTGFAYHVKSPGVSKGAALETVAPSFGLEPDAFAAIGDSMNDVELFDVAGDAYAVANADEDAKAGADQIVDGSFSDGFLDALDQIES